MNVTTTEYPQRDEYGKLPDVRDWKGNKVWFVTLQSLREKTCLDCGNVVPEGDKFCAICRGPDFRRDAKTGRNLIYTISYLKSGEFILLKK